MSFHPRHGLPPPRHPMFMGVPPPNIMSGPPPTGNPPPMFFNNAPPPPHGMNKHRPHGPPGGGPYVIQAKPSLNQNLLPTDHPSPFPNSGPIGPPVTVFVGNITEKWPDAMVRQLLSTCGYVLNWKRVQGASGKLQAFGFCEYGGPDAGLRAVRLLHDLEVGEKKLVVKVDPKTKDVFDEFKAERKKHMQQGDDTANEDYIDDEMKEGDSRSKMRIGILFREFKDELDGYVPPGTTDKPEKDPIVKQAIQDKLHLLKLTSLDAPLCDPETGDDAATEEGKREIISQEIVKFREHMKVEKEKEEERKKISKERRERQQERENAEKSRRDREDGSPGRRKERDSSSRHTRSPSRNSDGRPGSRSRLSESNRDRDRDRRDRDRDRRGRSREERVERVARDRDREREREREREWSGSRRRSRERRSRSRSPRERSPLVAPHKRRYREREMEEEAEEQRKQDKKAREKAAAYDDRLRLWEQREDKKRRERLKDKDRQERILEQTAKDAKVMKEFLEDYDDEQLDTKYYKGKDLQKRLSDRTKELEGDNRDRQREREEIEEMRLKVLTSGGVLPGSGVIPVITLDRQVKKPILDISSTSQSPSQPQLLTKKSVVGTVTVNSRLQALAGQPAGTTPPQISQNNGISYQPKNPTERRASATGAPLQTTFTAGQFNTFGPLPKTCSPSSTPNSLVSPSGAPIVEMSPSIRSLANTGFTVAGINTNSSDAKYEDDGTRNSYTPGNSNSPAMTDSATFDREDDSSLQESPDFQKKKKMNVKDVFNQDEEDNAFGAKKRKLVPLDYGDGNKPKKEIFSGGAVVDDKKKSIKSLIERIPTEKDALFAYGIDWTMVDNVLMEKRIRPWINKKIVEYIGEPEPTLVDFICTKVLSKSNPATILDDVQMVLDDEAEVFVVKMWRLLVYEIEAKKIGLATASKT